MGYLCTGKTEEAHQESRIEASQQEEKQNRVLLEIQQKEKDSKPHLSLEENHDLDMWEGHWTLQSQVNTALIHYPEPDNCEEIDWETFWTLESAGTEEFANSQKEEKLLMDQKVWEKFNETIEKRKDGYYVRLPWKEVTTPLPDNKAIAFNRLVSVWKSLQKDENLLNL
ncbi:hypothetical protein KIN20_012759 [Parelaphostrongylus tenuis]|uniref:Uncharacterized protein n=1 Tax=Parelaphostrongylus tenuis TaxID=148309 RepID=A0AAD5QKH7_PARTN|nr:hypothetical protein KIN20_012759 [Parelaphostrongylus tenuis]